jgi:hypothetical protein
MISPRHLHRTILVYVLVPNPQMQDHNAVAEVQSLQSILLVSTLPFCYRNQNKNKQKNNPPLFIKEIYPGRELMTRHLIKLGYVRCPCLSPDSSVWTAACTFRGSLGPVNLLSRGRDELLKETGTNFPRAHSGGADPGVPAGRPRAGR